MPNVAVAILGVGGLASHEVGYAQLTDGLSCLQSAFALVNTGNQGGKIEPVNTQVTQTRRSQQARAIPESLNRLSQTLAALQQIQNLPEADKLLFDILKTLPEITANAKKDIGALIDQNPRYNDLQKLIELESAKASAVIAAATGLENVSSSEQINTKPLEFTGKGPKIEAKIKKLSVRKKILFAVGAVLGLACCAVLIAGTFGAAAIPLAILGGVAGTSILSGVGVQLAQKKLENSNDAVAPKLADLQKSNLYTLEKWREDNGIKAIMDIFQEIDASQKLGPDFNSWRLPR